MTRFWIVLAFAGVSAISHAQDAKPGNVTYREVTVIDIEQDLALTAVLAKPGGIAFNETPRGVFNPLIRLRQNFDEELEASVDEVK